MLALVFPYWADKAVTVPRGHAKVTYGLVCLFPIDENRKCEYGLVNRALFYTGWKPDAKYRRFKMVKLKLIK